MRLIRCLAVALFVCLAMACTSPPSSPVQRPVSEAPFTPHRSTDPGPVALPAPGDYTWALGAAGEPTINGPAPAETATYRIESVAKVWIAADWLRLHPDVDETALGPVIKMLSASDNQIAEEIFRALGADESTARMIERCGLRATTAVAGYWARTTTTAADLVRLGRCVVDGRAAGPRHTTWLLERMQAPHEQGGWGIIDGVKPSQPVAFMNGWTEYPTHWQVNCLGIGGQWVLAVMVHYRTDLGLDHGRNRCQAVAGAFSASGVLGG